MSGENLASWAALLNRSNTWKQQQTFSNGIVLSAGTFSVGANSGALIVPGATNSPNENTGITLYNSGGWWSFYTAGAGTMFQVRTDGTLNIQSGVNNINAGQTAGTLQTLWPFQGSATGHAGSYKLGMLLFTGFENDTANNITITFPTTFDYTPVVSVNTTGMTVQSITTTTLTLTATNSTQTYSGMIKVEGW